MAYSLDTHKIERISGHVHVLQKIFKGFSQLCAPLNDLTKKGAFKWNEEAQMTMDKMKKVMSTCPVLALPDFSLPFTLECDASGEGIGVIAYELELPQGSRIHNVFHVSCLKKAIGQHITPFEVLPPMDEEGQFVLIPEEILEVREKRLRNRSIKEYLIRWKDLPIEDSTWENEQVVRETGLELLEDKKFLVGETVMSPTS
jgi:hypothetical protein